LTSNLTENCQKSGFLIQCIRLSSMTTQSTISAISNERLEAIISPWAKSIKNGESGSFWYYNKSDLYWRIANLREQKPLFRKYFGDRLFVVIDAESFRSENESDWNTAFQVSNRSGQQEVIYAITGLDRQLLENDSHAFHIVQKKESLLHPSHFLFFFTLDVTHPRFRPLFDGASIFLQNTAVIPLHTNDDTQRYITYKSNQWKIQVTEKQKRAIVERCGGYFLLVKEALRYVRDNKNTDIDMLFIHEEMHWRLNTIWNHFLPSEQSVFQKIVRGSAVFNTEERHSLKFLLAGGFLTTRGRSYNLSIPLLTEYIHKTNPMYVLSYDNKRIYYNNVPIENNFSPQEQKLMQFLLSKPSIIVSRDEISEKLAGSNTDDSLSDWAIDQLVSRIRKRLATIGISAYVIKTIRTKGFMYLPDTQ